MLNVGPKPNGQLPDNKKPICVKWRHGILLIRKAIENVSRWIIPNEENIWFTWKPKEQILYAFLTKLPDWSRGSRKDFVIKSVQTSEKTDVSVLGQSSELVEYQPTTDVATYFKQEKDGLHVSCVRTQRIYNNSKWTNPMVLKLTNVEPALEPPVVVTKSTTTTKTGSVENLLFNGEVVKMGDTEKLKVGFQYREYAGFVEALLYSDEWKETQTIQVSGTGEFCIKPSLRKSGKEYQIKAFIEHPNLKVYGDMIRVKF